MTQFFQFESDFVESLHCIPMQVRYKLDTCGIKLKLNHWNQFEPPLRQTLVDLPCRTEAEIQNYRTVLKQAVRDRTGVEPKDLPVEDFPDWLNEAQIPDSVQQKSAQVGASISPEQWQSLTPLQRFALIKLSRSGHENSNFLPALKEFEIA